jgi:hypothetical protein
MSMVHSAAELRSNVVSFGQSLHTGPVSNQTFLAHIPSQSVWGRNMEEECICIGKSLLFIVFGIAPLAYYVVLLFVGIMIAAVVPSAGTAVLVIFIMLLLLAVPSVVLMIIRKYVRHQKILYKDIFPCCFYCMKNTNEPEGPALTAAINENSAV